MKDSSRDHAPNTGAAPLASELAGQECSGAELDWDTAPIGEVLWGVYGPECFPTVFACKILDHPAQGRVLWGFSVYRRSPGFRTLGVSGLWAEANGLRLFSTPADAFAHISHLFEKAMQS